MPLNVKKILSAIFDAPEAPTCLACQDALDAYIDSELDGKDATTRFAHIKAHLNDCSDCQTLYEDMQSLFLMEREGRLMDLPIEPKFDFSHLRIAQDVVSTTSCADTTPQELWKMVERGRKQVMELFTELHVVLSQGQAFFSQLPNPLVAEWEVVPMGSRASPSEPQVPTLLLPSPEHDLSLRLIITPSESEEHEATLSIEVKQISDQLLVNRARVTIRDAQYRMLESDFTSQNGRVDFTDVQLGSYVIEVKYQGKVRQLPVTLR